MHNLHLIDFYIDFASTVFAKNHNISLNLNRNQCPFMIVVVDGMVLQNNGCFAVCRLRHVPLNVANRHP